MNLIYEWLGEYDVEYNMHTKILQVNKPIPVREFMLLKKLLIPYKEKVKDIVVGRWI